MNTALQQKIGVSGYLSGLAHKYPSLNISLAAEPFAQLQRVYDHLAALDLTADYRQTEAEFVKSKAEFAFIWSLAEFSETGRFTERGQWQTRFAELTIDLALRAAWIEVARGNKSIQKSLQQHPGGMPGLFIFGMGKLGGGDLNFSSDVDLVAFFDPGLLPVPDMLGKSYICHQVLQQLTRLLGQNNRPGFIWRVDWRLRPNASATTLAMSSEAAQEYYFFRASPWHRLALMKARVVAGDRVAGKAFMDAITPFIWRQNLDYRALDELAEIKQRINLEHPALRAQRQWREPINEEVGGFNVKLGTGGIREIEFIANALQLVWGGKRYSLRTPNTVRALRVLATQKLLDAELANELIDSYKMLRRIENAIQITGNQQTHLIPGELPAQRDLLLLLGEDNWPEFVENLNRYRVQVSNCFEDLFAEQNDVHDEPISWPANLNDAARQIVTAWEKGFHIYGVSTPVRQRLKPLTRALADYLANAEKIDPRESQASATVMRLHDYFRSLPQGEQYFRLLAESPRLLASMIPPLLYSPAMSILLRQSPHIIDCFMERSTPAPGRPQQFVLDSSYVLQADRYEVRLERMRRFVNEQLYQYYLVFLQGQLEAVAFQQLLSDLAVHTLELALEVVTQNMHLPMSPITVLGMGKVAMRKMSPLSDLDLIFIFNQENTPLELASKFVSRLQTAISTPMREGIVYELDTRLRPSGRSGAATVSIESFALHQMQRAHSWEHIALVPGSVVAGDRSLEARILQVKRNVVCRPRDQQQFLRDAAKMWQRISAHRVKDFGAEVMFSKLRPGGLMQSEYLAACLILHQPPESASLQFDALLAQRVAGDSSLPDIPEILQFWRIQQLWERLLGCSEQPVEGLPQQYLEHLLRQSGVDSLAALLAKKQRYAEQVMLAMQDFFAELNASNFVVDDWREEKVNWLDHDVNT